jgi:predicted phosphodiesterase
MKIGLLADSVGDLNALDRATTLLLQQGAERLFFLGGRYPDVEEMLLRKKSQQRGGREYDDQDFLSDVSAFLGRSEGGLQAKLRPTDEHERLRERFSRVPCKESLEYRDPQVPKKLVEMVGDVLACLVHDKADLVKDDMLNAVFLIHGKSPEPNVVQIGPRFFVTPGRLTGASEQTCALLELVGNQVRFDAFTLEGKNIKHLELAMARKTNLSVK